MKKLLFISRSTLPHNLLRAVLPLVPFPVDLTCIHTPEEVSQMTGRVRPFHMVLLDFNAIDGSETGDQTLEQFRQQPRLKESSFVLIHSDKDQIQHPFFENAGFTGIYQKPFSTGELAGIITKILKGET